MGGRRDNRKPRNTTALVETSDRLWIASPSSPTDPVRTASSSSIRPVAARPRALTPTARLACPPVPGVIAGARQGKRRRRIAKARGLMHPARIPNRSSHWQIRPGWPAPATALPPSSSSAPNPGEWSPGLGSAQPIACDGPEGRPRRGGREPDNRERGRRPARSATPARRMALLDQWPFPAWDGAGAPGGASQGQSPARGAPDRGAAQRRRLDLRTAQFGNEALYSAIQHSSAVTSPPSVPPRQPVSTFRLCCL